MRWSYLWIQLRHDGIIALEADIKMDAEKRDFLRNTRRWQERGKKDWNKRDDAERRYLYLYNIKIVQNKATIQCRLRSDINLALNERRTLNSVSVQSTSNETTLTSNVVSLTHETCALLNLDWVSNTRVSIILGGHCLDLTSPQRPLHITFLCSPIIRMKVYSTEIN